ncbi:SDR family NAD(P)-dependent oxidoreductase [Streptomyces sp. SID2999]|uniref:SDR family oxidoreductase n=1 Tax=Streptomyces sp. SID2999 TaxID=2690258 RepID=UPI0013685915|nr:SDR family oxidoreductase [Streptomyces sp. SID2999]MYZ07745.1 SDR family NAD(P)-dependent oxidoreductase [Streptomyces sp. SID2999]
MTRRWLVTGCSSGLGRAVVEAAARAGNLVVATARRPAVLEELAARFPDRLTTAALDVCDPAQCAAAVEHAVDRFGGVDVLVNNAGAGLFGAVEEVTDDELRAQLEILTVAPWRLARLVLPLMRAQGSGHIVNVSSLAGRTGFPGLSAYVAGKYALEGMSQVLAAEAAPFGIRVSAVEPGGFATRYGAALAEAVTRIPAYEGITRDMRSGLRGMEDNPALGRPEEFAALLLGLVAADSVPVRVPVGADAFAFLELVEEAARRELETARTLATDAPEPPETAAVTGLVR